MKQQKAEAVVLAIQELVAAQVSYDGDNRHPECRAMQDKHADVEHCRGVLIEALVELQTPRAKA